MTDLPRMLRNKLRRRNPLADELPWMPFQAIEFLDQSLRAEHRVFEFGSGGSTLFFARRAAHVVTVEHDEKWASIVKETLTARGMLNVDLHPISPEFGVRDEFGSDSPGFENASFRRYVETIHKFPSAHFDVVIVDGRARNACLREALPHVKPGGIVVLDNSERPYDEGKKTYVGREAKRFYGLNPYQLFPGETTIWRI